MGREREREQEANKQAEMQVPVVKVAEEVVDPGSESSPPASLPLPRFTVVVTGSAVVPGVEIRGGPMVRVVNGVTVLSVKVSNMVVDGSVCTSLVGKPVKVVKVSPIVAVVNGSSVVRVVKGTTVERVVRGAKVERVVSGSKVVRVVNGAKVDRVVSDASVLVVGPGVTVATISVTVVNGPPVLELSVVEVAVVSRVRVDAGTVNETVSAGPPSEVLEVTAAVEVDSAMEEVEPLSLSLPPASVWPPSLVVEVAVLRVVELSVHRQFHLIRVR